MQVILKIPNLTVAIYYLYNIIYAAADRSTVRVWLIYYTYVWAAAVYTRRDRQTVSREILFWEHITASRTRHEYSLTFIGTNVNRNIEQYSKA